MSEALDAANRMVMAVERLPPGAAQIAAALAVADRIEADGPDEARAFALNMLVRAYCFGGEPEKAYVPFGRVVAWYDAHPEHFDEIDRRTFHWSFKWMVGDLMDYPRIPWAQLEATVADMERRYALAGFGLSAPRQARWRLAWHRGGPDAPELFDAWIHTPPDDMSDCTLCATGDEVVYHLEHGHLDEGLRLLEATLDDPNARRECTDEPATVLSWAQLAYLRRGGPGDAARAVRAYRRCREAIGGIGADGETAGHNRRPTELVGVRARCVEFLARARHADEAIRLLEANEGLLLEAGSPLARLRFLWHVGVALHLIVDELGGADHPVALSGGMVAGTPVVTAAELWTWVRHEADGLAEAFDARNQTHHLTDAMHADWQADAEAECLDLRVAAPPPEEASRASSLVETTSVESAVAGTTGADELLRRAERAAWEEERELAIGLYLEAADGFERAGRLSDAGFARAEAGRWALLLDDLETAETCLRRACQVLRAADVPPPFVAPVATTLAGALARRGRIPEAGAVLDETAASLAALADDPPGSVAPEVAATHADDRAWAATLVDDVRAATLIGAGERARGGDLARAVAERYAGLGLIVQASAAFARAGEALAGDHDEAALWCLESAVEGYGLCGRRAERARVAGTLLACLRRLGRDEQASRLVAGL